MTPMVPAIEAQYDARRGEVTLVASQQFGSDRYVVKVPAASPAEAEQAIREFYRMYEEIVHA